MAKKLETKVMPKYPEEAKAHHDIVNGACTLGLIVDEQGLPTQLTCC